MGTSTTSSSSTTTTTTTTTTTAKTTKKPITMNMAPVVTLKMASEEKAKTVPKMKSCPVCKSKNIWACFGKFVKTKNGKTPGRGRCRPNSTSWSHCRQCCSGLHCQSRFAPFKFKDYQHQLTSWNKHL